MFDLVMYMNYSTVKETGNLPGQSRRLPIHWCFGIFRKMHYYFYETILVERMKEFLFMKMENNNGGKV
ncbi:hypothetical protein NXX23_26775 [Bacteroides ovatus]|nr:hypothetical protein [Bacteroides ovatus]